MIWLTWRQFRAQALAGYALLALLAAVLLVTGRPVIRAGAMKLSATDDLLYQGGVIVMYVLPAVIGVFWGAPLVTRELEAGTHRLVWNQTVTRTRWLLTKLALTGLAAAAASGLLSAVVTWWAGPVDAAAVTSTIASDGGDVLARLHPLIFGARGIVPIGYGVFAFALGVAVGILLRRTVFAMAVALVVFLAVQLLVPFAVRPNLLPATTETVPIVRENISQLGISHTQQIEVLEVAGPQGSWLLANQTVDATGKATTAPSWLVDCLPGPGKARANPSSEEQCFAKLTEQGYRQQITYHAATRFWPLQWIELGIYLFLAAGLALLSLRWTRHRLS